MSEEGAARRRLEPDERRAQILVTAVRFFGEQPYAEVSTADLAREAGVTRGLLHHYFGTKRDLYLEVVRAMMFVPALEEAFAAEGSREERVERTIGWLLDVIESHGRTWVAASSAEGVGSDPAIREILDEADDLAAGRVLDTVGFVGTVKQRRIAIATIRCFGGMTKAASREMVDRRSMTRQQVQVLLTHTLLAVLDEALPAMDKPRT